MLLTATTRYKGISLYFRKSFVFIIKFFIMDKLQLIKRKNLLERELIILSDLSTEEGKYGWYELELKDKLRSINRWLTDIALDSEIYVKSGGNPGIC